MTDPLRVVIVTQNAPVYLGSFVGKCLELLQDSNIKVTGVIVLPPLFHKSSWLEAKARLQVYGWRDFLAMSMHVLYGYVEDALWRVGFQQFSPRLKTILQHYHVPILPFNDINSMAVEQYLSEHVDIFVSIACPHILKKHTLKAPRLGVLNYHTGALPHYRGRQPLYWALLHGESEVGITVHEMEVRLDSGPIVEQEMVDIAGVKTLHECYKRTLAQGPSLLVKAIQKVANGDPERKPNPDLGIPPNRFPTRNDGQQFRSKGLRIY